MACPKGGGKNVVDADRAAPRWRAWSRSLGGFADTAPKDLIFAIVGIVGALGGALTMFLLLQAALSFGSHDTQAPITAAEAGRPAAIAPVPAGLRRPQPEGLSANEGN